MELFQTIIFRPISDSLDERLDIKLGINDRTEVGQDVPEDQTWPPDRYEIEKGSTV